MTIEEMKRRKRELGYSFNKLSELSGVPVGTLQKIFSGETSSPRYNTIQAISEVLSDAPAEEVHELSEAFVLTSGKALPDRYYEGEKTIDDYIALPEGTRVELIDGKFYDMAAPTTIHQSISFEICYLLKNYVSRNGGKCVPFVAPTDVQLDCDNKTMVQPDVLVVCDRDKITKPRIVGAPDFIVEVLSPSNWYHDTQRKLWKYKQAGVREYWIVMPEQMKIHVYEFEKSDEPTIYTFDAEIPVGIWDGKCRVDFKKIYDTILEKRARFDSDTFTRIKKPDMRNVFRLLIPILERQGFEEIWRKWRRHFGFYMSGHRSVLKT